MVAVLSSVRKIKQLLTECDFFWFVLSKKVIHVKYHNLVKIVLKQTDLMNNSVCG